MSVKVETPFLETFQMPQICVGCGGIPGPNMTWKVTGSQSVWDKKHTLTLQFPLCPQCYVVSRSKPAVGLLLVAGLVASLVSWFVFLSLSINSDNDIFLGIIFLFALPAVLLVGSFLLAKSINKRGLTVEQQKRRMRVSCCARICSFKLPGFISNTSGSVVFEFENLTFADDFAFRNLGRKM